MYRSHGYTGSRHFTSDRVIKEGNRDRVVTRVQSHTSVEVSSVSVAPYPRRSFSPKCVHRHEAPPAFTSLRQLVKPQNPGVTIVNVYNCEKDRAVQLPKRQPRQKTVKVVEKVHRETRKGCAVSEGHQCLTTDEDRNRVLKLEKLLPRWHEREEAGHKVMLDDWYCKEEAINDWEAFYETQAKKKGRQTTGQPDNCYCKEEAKRGTDEVAVTMAGQMRHATSALYGTAETQKICQNAIQQVLKCEKELQQLQFTSSSVLPQTGECLAKLRWVHECLKLFLTHYRELEEETHQKLQTRVGNNFTIKMAAPGKHELPFPKHLH